MSSARPKVLPPNRLLGTGLVVAACVAALTWLNLRADAIVPEQHENYTRLLREMRELDARVNAEVLANRLELSRNYDALTAYTQRTLDAGKEMLAMPGFLSPDHRARQMDMVQALDDTLLQKAELVDRFKRDNSVLRNSLAFFPVAVDQLLARSAHPAVTGEAYTSIAHYARHLLAFARAPSATVKAEILALRKPLASLALTVEQRLMLDNLTRHGDVITQRLVEHDRLTQDILILNTGSQLEALALQYAGGHASANRQAGRYRLVLYALAVMLTTYLAWTFLRLKRISRSLALAHREVSDRYAAQLVAEKQLKLHATAFQSAHDGITLTDAEGNILDVNPAFSRITGWSRDEVIGRNPRVLKSGRHDQAFYAAMWKSIVSTGSWRGEIWNRNKYGDIYPELLSISAIKDSNGRLTNFVAVFADISRIKAQEKQLTKMAYYDTLTDLPNRSLLADRLTQSMSQCQRTGSLMAVVYLDLDGFKQINDTWGHDMGDRVLVEMAERLKQELRGGDSVARLGGDEFAILLLDLKDREEAISAIQRMLRAIARPLLATPQPTSLSGSMGVTQFPEDDSDADTLLRHADQAMYQAKQSGKNNYHFFDPEQDRDTRTRHDTVARIREALENNEFVLYYQPKVNMRAGKVIGAEALIRWIHPERGIIPPLEFLPLIENDPVLVAIGDWVIDTALAQMERWHAEGIDLRISVNIAGNQLQHPEFLQKLRVAVDRHPVVARNLELEVLETAALEDVVKVSQVIEECQALGIGFALDDFGTGYSSLTYLKRLPAETIKIDQSFVRDLLNDNNNLVIVQGVLGLATAFQRNAIAEGVETVEHGRMLLQIECEQAQGYGISRPMEAGTFHDWMLQWRPDPSWDAVRNLFWETADYPLMIAEVEHRNWVAQLIYTTNEYRPVPHPDIGNPRHCRFGRWYEGQLARTRYQKLAAFHQIEAPHLRVHEIADRIDAFWNSGRIDEARELIPELIIARDEVLAALRELQLAIASPRQFK